MRLPTLAFGFGLAVMAACGSGGSGDDGVDASTDAADGWQTLMQGSWQLDGGDEAYFCVYATVPRDIYIKGFRPIIPNGTHHTVLTKYTGTQPDGIVPCSAGTNGQSMIYGSGVGSPDFAFPSGVGLHLTAGTRLLLNLHLFNSSDQVLTGTSGTLFQEATAAEVQNLAEIVLAGPTFTLSVPPGVSTQSGTCNISNITSSQPVQVFALSQHMHKLGTNLRSVIRRGGTDIMLQDVPYDFETQSFQLVQPTVELRPGDVLTTYCTYNNTTGQTVRFGDSSDDEMCFTDLFYYPAQNAQFICTGT